MYIKTKKSTGLVRVGTETREQRLIEEKVRDLKRNGYRICGTNNYNCAGLNFTEVLLQPPGQQQQQRQQLRKNERGARSRRY